MQKISNQLRWFLSAFMAVVLLLTGFTLSSPREVQAAISFVDDTSDDSLVKTKGRFSWDFSKFEPNTVWKDPLLKTILNEKMVTTSGFVDAGKVRSYIASSNNATLREMLSFAVGSKLLNADGSYANPSVTYHNLGQIVSDHGSVTDVDMKVTVESCDLAGGVHASHAQESYVYFSVCLPPATTTDFYNKEAVGIYVSNNVRSINLRYEFFKAGTNTKVNVAGTFTQVDLDWGQWFAFEDAVSNVKQLIYYKIAKDHLTRNTNSPSTGWTTIQASLQGLEPPQTYQDEEYKKGYVTSVFESDTVRFQYGIHAPDNNYKAGQNTLLHSYFGILPYSVSAYEAPTPYKYVTGETGITDPTKIDQTSLYLKSGRKDVTFSCFVDIPRSLEHNYRAFRMTDVLNKVVNVPEPKDIKIFQDGTKDVTDKLFDIDIDTEKQTVVTATAKKSAIAEENGLEFFGHRYYMVIETKINEKALKDMDKENGYYHFTNTVSCVTDVWKPNGGLDADDGEYVTSGSIESNQVHVYYTCPGLKVDKRVKDKSGRWVERAEFDSGDAIEYQILVVQTDEKAMARGLIVEDPVVPPGVTITDISAEYCSNGTVYTSGGSPNLVKKLTGVNGVSIANLGSDEFAMGYGQIKTPKNTPSETVSVTGDYLKVTLKGMVGAVKLANRANTAEATYEISDGKRSEPETDSARISTNGTMPSLKVTKEFRDDYGQLYPDGASMLGAKVSPQQAKITIEQDPDSPIKNLPVYITDITDYMVGMDGNGAAKTASNLFQLPMTATGITFRVYDQSGRQKTDVQLQNYFTVGHDASMGYEDSFALRKKASLNEKDQILCLQYGEKIEILYNLSMDSRNVLKGIAAGEEQSPVQNTVEVEYCVESGSTLSPQPKVSAGDSFLPLLNMPKITKTSDKEVYEVGETIHYQIKIENKSDYPGFFKFTDYFTNPDGKYEFDEESWIADGSIEEEKEYYYYGSPIEIEMGKALPKSNYSFGGLYGEDHDFPYSWWNQILDSVRVTDAEGNVVGQYGEKYFNLSIGMAGNEPSQLPENSRPGADSPVFYTPGNIYYNGMHIPANEVYTITYDVPVESFLYRKDESLTNVSRLTWLYNNDEDVIASETACSTVTVVRPQLQLEKTVSGAGSDSQEHSGVSEESFAKQATIGAGAWYRLRVEQKDPRVSAKNVRVRDILPGDLTLKKGSVAVEQAVMDADQGTEVRTPVNVSVSYEDNGFSFVIPQMPATAYYVYYYVSTKPSAAGKTLENQAFVTADNGDGVQDTATVDVLINPELSVKKSSDQSSYRLGQTGHYTVTVTQTKPGAEAYNVSVSDVLDGAAGGKTGVVLQQDSIHVSTTGRQTGADPVITSAPDSSGKIRTGIQTSITLGYGQTLTVQYDVVFREQALVYYEKTVKNTAVAFADNAEEVTDSCSVTVNASDGAITITKRIRAEDIVWENGNPIFEFHLEGTDLFGESHGYNKYVEFTEEYVTAHTGADGYTELSVVFEKLLPGVYTASEKDALRYTFKQIDQVTGGSVQGETVRFDLNTSKTASARFENEKEIWNAFTDTDLCVNHFGTARR